jgi:hypothetical protein
MENNFRLHSRQQSASCVYIPKVSTPPPDSVASINASISRNRVDLQTIFKESMAKAGSNVTGCTCNQDLSHRPTHPRVIEICASTLFILS